MFWVKRKWINVLAGLFWQLWKISSSRAFQRPNKQSTVSGLKNSSSVLWIPDLISRFSTRYWFTFCRNATPSYHFSTTSGKNFFFVKMIFYKVICLVFFISLEEIWISRDVIDSSFYSAAKEFISEMLFMKFPTLWISHFPSNEEGDNHWLLTSNH